MSHVLLLLLDALIPLLNDLGLSQQCFFSSLSCWAVKSFTFCRSRVTHCPKQQEVALLPARRLVLPNLHSSRTCASSSCTHERHGRVQSHVYNGFLGTESNTQRSQLATHRSKRLYHPRVNSQAPLIRNKSLARYKSSCSSLTLSPSLKHLAPWRTDVQTTSWFRSTLSSLPQFFTRNSHIPDEIRLLSLTPSLASHACSLLHSHGSFLENLLISASLVFSLLLQEPLFLSTCQRRLTTLHPSCGSLSSLCFSPAVADINLLVTFMNLPRSSSTTICFFLKKQHGGVTLDMVQNRRSWVEHRGRREQVCAAFFCENDFFLWNAN